MTHGGAGLYRPPSASEIHMHVHIRMCACACICYMHMYMWAKPRGHMAWPRACRVTVVLCMIVFADLANVKCSSGARGSGGVEATSPPPPLLELPSLLRLHSSSASATRRSASATAYDRARAGAGATLKERIIGQEKQNGKDWLFVVQYQP